MKIETRDFGTVEINESDLIHFVQPVYGFEHLSDYVLLSDKNFGDGIRWLQSAEEKDVCFIVINPSDIFTDYAPTVPLATRLAMRAGTSDNLECWVIAVIAPDFKKSTVNLKSPIFIYPEKMNGAQLILDQDYSIRTPLFNSEKGV